MARTIELPDATDEVTASDYVHACERVSRAALALREVSADEAAEHWLPELTQYTAIIFSFIGSNMTARNMPRYAQTLDAMQAAKDVTSATEAGTLPSTTS